MNRLNETGGIIIARDNARQINGKLGKKTALIGGGIILVGAIAGAYLLDTLNNQGDDGGVNTPYSINGTQITTNTTVGQLPQEVQERFNQSGYSNNTPVITALVDDMNKTNGEINNLEARINNNTGRIIALEQELNNPNEINKTLEEKSRDLCPPGQKYMINRSNFNNYLNNLKNDPEGTDFLKAYEEDIFNKGYTLLILQTNKGAVRYLMDGDKVVKKADLSENFNPCEKFGGQI